MHKTKTGKRFNPKNRKKNNNPDSRNNSSSHNNGGSSSSRRSGHSNNRRNNSKRGKKTGIDLSKYINPAGEKVEATVYSPENQFSDFSLDKKLKDEIKSKGFESPTEIQDRAIPLALSGKNVVGLASTGTGKTAAFLIPIIQNLIKNKDDRFALIISPTRELANQINDEFRSLTKGMALFSACLIGGSSVRKSITSLSKVNHVIIGTPGRLMDMHRQGHLRFNNFKVFVLDEFDRMLDIGFQKEIQTINNKMTAKEQTLLFSATVDDSQQELVNDIAGKDAKVIRTASNVEQKTSAIRQEVLRVKGQDRFDLMMGLLTEREGQKVILFCETKRKVEKLQQRLRNSPVRSDVIHGDKSQRAREVALRKFKKGQISLLIATDVVARGIDVDDVALVINYEPPRNYSDYVHRIGRTGRAGKMGHAITMID